MEYAVGECEKYRSHCLNCGTEIADGADKCISCGIPKGMTAQQHKYANYRENGYIPVAIILTLSSVVLWIIFGASLWAFVGMSAVTVSVLSLCAAIYDKTSKGISVVCLSVNVILMLMEIVKFIRFYSALYF